MQNAELLGSVAMQMMGGDTHIEVDGKSVPLMRTSVQQLRTVTFTIKGREYTAIEQNPEKRSRWGELARAGHQVMQFKDALTNHFIAVAVDGQVQEYGGSRRQG